MLEETPCDFGCNFDLCIFSAADSSRLARHRFQNPENHNQYLPSETRGHPGEMPGGTPEASPWSLAAVPPAALRFWNLAREPPVLASSVRVFGVSSFNTTSRPPSITNWAKWPPSEYLKNECTRQLIVLF